jgi:hypothetical protein
MARVYIEDAGQDKVRRDAQVLLAGRTGVGRKWHTLVMTALVVTLTKMFLRPYAACDDDDDASIVA